MKNISLIVAVLALSIFFSQCKKEDDNSCVDGNGTLQMDSRVVDLFANFTASGSYVINFSKSSDSKVDIFTDSNISPLVVTNVEDESLNIGISNDQCYTTANPIELTLTAPEIRNITFNGDGSIDGHSIIQDLIYFNISGSIILNTSIEVNSVELYLDGSEDANLIGSAVDAILETNGTGSILAPGLVVEDCFITTTGTGDVRIHVNGLLDVTIAGTGNVYYSGNPETINSDITGTGELIKVN